VAIGDLALAQQIVAGPEPRIAREANGLVSAEAILMEATGDARALELYRRAAKQWGEYGSVVERAHALAGAGRCGDAAAASEADGLFASLGVRRGDAALSAAG
jgi:hypothetical protein